MVKKNKKMFFIGALFVIALNIFLYFRKSKIQNLGIIEIEGFGNISIQKEENVTFRPTEIIVNCSKDEDCDWIITNCCKEEAGAQWQCLNKNSYIDCQSKLVLCPNVTKTESKLQMFKQYLYRNCVCCWRINIFNKNLQINECS
jgi:hypothetical protein